MEPAIRQFQLKLSRSKSRLSPGGRIRLAALAPALTLLVLIGPIVAGLAGTVLPAFGYLPALGGNRLTLEPSATLMAMPGLLRSCLISLVCGILTAGISIMVVMLFTAAWYGTRTFSRIAHLISPLLSVPHAAAAFGLAFLIAPAGIAARLISPELTGWQTPPDLLIVNDRFGLAMMAGLIVKEIPFLLLVTLAAIPQVNAPANLMLTTSLGYGRTAGFLFALWPRIYAQIRLAVYAVIAYATAVVDVAVILGPTTPAPLAVRLLQWMNDPALDMRFVASAGAILQLFVTATAMGIWYGLEKAGSRLARAICEQGWRWSRDAAFRAAILGLTTLSAAIIVIGLTVLAIWSFAGQWPFPDALPQTISWRSWSRALPQIADPLLITIAVGATATLIALGLGFLCLEREYETRNSGGNRSLLLLYLPLIIPQAAFLFGLQVLILQIGLEPSIALLVGVHLVFVLPYVFLSFSDPWRAFDQRYDLVAAGLGRGRLSVLMRIRLPMLARAALTAAAVGFAVSVGQYLPTVLIGSGRLTTITTEAVSLASGGNWRVIGVYAFLQTILPFLAFAIAGTVPAILFRQRRGMRL